MEKINKHALFENIDNSWLEILDNKNLENIIDKLNSQNIKYFPNNKNILKAFKYFKLKQTKLVLLGQDPYHNEKNNIPHKKWARGALNFTLPMPTIEMGTPHVDHDFEHKVMIMYLNEFTEGNTVIFKDKYNDKDSNTEKWSKPPVIDTEIKSEMGKVFVFDGLQYHANRFPGFGTHRLTCVITYI